VTIRNAQVSMTLARFAKVADGLVDMMGGGINQMPPQPGVLFIAGTITMPWEAAGIQHELRLDLLDDDGNLVPGEAQELPITGQFNVAPMPGLPKGSHLMLPLVIPVQFPSLKEGSRYEWRLWIDEETHEDWRLGFQTQPMIQSNAA
jgi:hypothetical protein